jgi:hypothetical protein
MTMGLTPDQLASLRVCLSDLEALIDDGMMLPRVRVVVTRVADTLGNLIAEDIELSDAATDILINADHRPGGLPGLGPDAAMAELVDAGMLSRDGNLTAVGADLGGRLEARVRGL